MYIDANFVSAIFCEPLPPNANGMIKPESCTIGKIKYGTRCEFGCNIGFEMSGPLKTSCTDKGKWSEGYEKARCIGKKEVVYEVDFVSFLKSGRKKIF